MLYERKKLEGRIFVNPVERILSLSAACSGLVKLALPRLCCIYIDLSDEYNDCRCGVFKRD